MAIPLLGPWCGLTMPIGIWLLILLRREDVRGSFEQAKAELVTNPASAEEAITTAGRLEKQGEWEAAIGVYNVVAARWPEHATYAENCIASLRQRLSGTG